MKFFKTILPIFIFLLFFALFLNLLSSHMLSPQKNGWHSGGSTWGDLAFHLSIISSFTWGKNTFFQQDPTFLGEKLSYPFFFDLISGFLAKLGLSLRWSLIIPSLIFIEILVILIYFLALKITKSRFSAILAPFIFLFNGSIFGLYYFWQDFKMSGFGFWDFLSKMTKEYAHLAQFNIRFSNIICDYLLPQRSIILGLVFGVLIIYFFWRYFENKERKNLLKAGLLTSFLPIIHFHIFLTMIILASFFGLIELIKNLKKFKKIIFNWLYFLIPIILIAPLQIIWIFPFGKENFSRFEFGWMKGSENIFWFWLKNLGLHLILFIIAFITASKKLKTFYLPFLGLFLITNIIIFQPHNYDNMKIMLFWFLLSCILIANLFQQILTRFSLKGLLIIIPLFLLLTVTGVLSVYRESYTSWLMFSNEDIKVANFIKENTFSDSIFLTSYRHNHLVPCLTGRKILMGYPGWLWTHGINYQERENDLKNIFNGGPQAKNLLEKYKINYAIIGPSEKYDLNANYNFYNKNYETIYQSDNYKIYKIKLEKPEN